MRHPRRSDPAKIRGLLSATNSAAQDQPTIAKDSVQVTAFTLSSYKKDFKVFSWVPKLKLRVNGPIASGSQLYAEFNVPGIGQLLVNGIYQRDLVTVQGVTLFVATAFVIVNFVVDILYTVLDPRIRRGHVAARRL